MGRIKNLIKKGLLPNDLSKREVREDGSINLFSIYNYFFEVSESHYHSLFLLNFLLEKSENNAS
jgi:hypothetical protein